jgi:hypothetical protein
MECVGTERTGYRNKNHVNGSTTTTDLIGYFTCSCPAFRKNGEKIDKFTNEND